MVQDEALKQQYLAQAKAKLKKEAKIMKIVKIVFSALLICIGIVCFIFSTRIWSSWYSGTTVMDKYYGGDAYTGIQNACADIANNVNALGNLVDSLGYNIIHGMKFLLMTISFVLAVVGIYLVIKNVLTRTKIDCELAQEMADEMYEMHLAKPAPQLVYNQYAPMQQMPYGQPPMAPMNQQPMPPQMPYGQPPMAPMNQPPVNPDQNNENN